MALVALLVRYFHTEPPAGHAMGQNNDPTEHGDLQGQQGGNLSKDPEMHRRMRQKEAGYARPPGDVLPRRKSPAEPRDGR